MENSQSPKGFLVKCSNKDCKMIRDLPFKYFTNYEQQDWKSQFKCSKLKLKNLICKHPYTFRPEQFAQKTKE